MPANNPFKYAAIAIAALALTACDPGAKTASTAKKETAVPVFLAKVESRDVDIWLEGNATVQAYNTVSVRPRVSGTITAINFTEGQKVQRGDVLAEIDARPYQAVLAQAKARLEQSHAKKKQDEALLGNARNELARVQGLVKLAGESQRSLDTQMALTAQLQASVAEDQAAIAAAQAAIDSAQLDLDFTTLRAPISGLTGIRQIDIGNTVTANQPEGLVVVTQTQPVSVVFTLAQRHLPVIRPHLLPGKKPLAVHAVMYNYGDDGVFTDDKLLAAGTLDIMDNQVDSATDNLRLKATFANKDDSLWPGQYVIARVLTDTRKGALCIPTNAVQDGINAPYVYVVKSDDTVETRTVRKGPQTGNFTVIEDGLKAGDRVVREGQNKLRPGMKVVEMKKTDAADGTAANPANPSAPAATSTTPPNRG